MARPKAELVLSPKERETLERLVRRRKTAQQLALRARIVLVCAQAQKIFEVARDLRWAQQTGGQVASAFARDRGARLWRKGSTCEPPGTGPWVSIEYLQSIPACDLSQ